MMGHLNLRWIRKGLGYDDELKKKKKGKMNSQGASELRDLLEVYILSLTSSKRPRNDRRLKRSQDNLKDKFYSFVFWLPIKETIVLPC